MRDPVMCPDCGNSFYPKSPTHVCECGTTWDIEWEHMWDDDREEVVPVAIIYRQTELFEDT